MKRLFIYIVFFLPTINLVGQQELSLHFMRDLAQSNLTNPAIFNKYKINITLPSPYASFYSSAFSANDVFEKEGSTLIFKPDDLISQLEEEDNQLQANVNLQSFSIGIQLNKLQFTLSNAIKVQAYINYPKGLFDVLWNGNAASIGQTINIGPGIDLMAYQEFGLGLAYRVSPFLSFGGKIKYLSGFGSIRSSRSNASIYTDPEYYQLTAQLDYQLNTAGVPISFDGEDEFITIDDFEPNFFGENKGFALDLGATLQITDRITLSASLIDVGQINWKENAKSWTSNGIYEYEGLDLQPLIQGDSLNFEDVLDTVEQVFQFEESSGAYNTLLPSKFYLSGTIKLKSLQLGALLYGEAFKQKFYPALALSARKEFGNIFSAGLVYSVRNNSFNNLGLNMALRLGGIQIYALTGNVFSFFDPLKARNVNAQIGLNLAFGKKKEKQNSVETQ